MAAEDSSLLTQFQNRMMATSQSEQPSLQHPKHQLPPLYSPVSPPHMHSGRRSQAQAVPFLQQNLHHHPHLSRSRSLSQPSSFFQSLSEMSSLQPPFGIPAMAATRPDANQMKVEEMPAAVSVSVPPQPQPQLVDVSMSDQEPSISAANNNASISASALPPLSPLSSHHQGFSRRHGDLLHHASPARFTPPVPSRGHRRSRSETPSFRFDTGTLSFPESSMTPVSFYQSFIDAAEERVGEAPHTSKVSEASRGLMKKETQWGIAMDTSDHLGSAATGETDDLLSACIDVDRIDSFGSLESILKGGKATDREEGIASSYAEDKDKVSEHGESFLDMASDSEKEDSDKEGSSYNISDTMMKAEALPRIRHSRSASVDDIVLPEGGDDTSEQKSVTSVREESHRSRQQQIRHHHSFSMDGSSFNLKNLGSELKIDGGDMKKTMTTDRLAELALIDPKRAKRILANRLSAARSKERKMRYISELERKVQTLQTEATTLSAQLTLMQRDSTGLFNENNELKLKLQAMEQQAQLREALNEALRGEVERLKLATAASQMLQQPQFYHHQASVAGNGPHPSSSALQQQVQQQRHQMQQQQQHGSDSHLPYPP